MSFQLKMNLARYTLIPAKNQTRNDICLYLDICVKSFETI
jgi:hypothetical protein